MVNCLDTESKIGYLTIDYKFVGGVSVLSEITETILLKRFALVKRNINDSILENLMAMRRCDKIVFSVGNVSNLLNLKVLLYVFFFIFTRKKLIYRGFAGGLRKKFTRTDLLKLQLIANFFEVITFETLADTEFFRKKLIRNSQVLWLPNHRSCKPQEETLRLDQIAYFGRITKSKGLEYLVEYSKKYNKQAVAFGPIDPGYSLPKEITYHGVIDHLDVNNRMRDYSYIFLHTSWPTEGYPGVLLEAFINGCSVITNIHNDMGELFVNNVKDELEIRTFQNGLTQVFNHVSYLNKWNILLDL